MKHAVLAVLVALAVLAVLPAAGAEPPRRTVALTFDDLPLVPPSDLAASRRATDALLGALTRHRASAVGFVNEDKLHIPGEMDERIALLERWLDAGALLGNHTYSHVNLRDTPLAAYQDDVLHGEVITRRLQARRGLAPPSSSGIRSPTPAPPERSRSPSRPSCARAATPSPRSPSSTPTTPTT
jgi:peptidoglycan/xylan/chitin deacetylase (PgdA/CDA1 family)